MALDFYDLVEMTASARTEYEDSLKEENKKLESEIADLYKSNSKLQDDNAEKISARTAISRKISHRKTGGGWLIFLAIAGAAAAWFGLKEEAMKLLQTLSFIGAGAVFVLGIVVRLSHRKYLGELENANADLSAFDKAQGDYFNQIRQRQAQIEENKKNLDVISEFKKDAEFYHFQHSVSTGHVIVAATGEFHAFADDPRKPSEGKNYSSDGYFVKKLEVYVDGGLRDTGKKVYFSDQGCLLSHIKLEPGDREIQFRVAYGIGDAIINEETIGPMQILAGASLFGWFHVSGCGKYTNVYKKSYGSLDEFRQAIGVSRSEIKGKLS